MDLKNIKPGMYVVIDKECLKTKKNYGFGGNMDYMCGTIQPVKEIQRESVIIGAYNWDPADLSITKLPKRKIIPPTQFNIKELDL